MSGLPPEKEAEEGLPYYMRDITSIEVKEGDGTVTIRIGSRKVSASDASLFLALHSSREIHVSMDEKKAMILTEKTTACGTATREGTTVIRCGTRRGWPIL